LVTTVPLAVSLERRADVSLAVQLAEQVRTLVTGGAVEPGSRLPSSRALAADLGVSRGVVEQAYDQLRAEGWMVTRRGAGSYAAQASAMQPGHAVPGGEVPWPRETPPAVRLDTGTPWVDPRQDAGWRRAWREVAAAPMPSGYHAAAGLPELRAQLAAHVRRTRGLDCSAGNVMVTSGTTHGLRLLLEALPPGAVAVEDPGYRAAVAVVRESGRVVVDVPVGDEGLDVQELARAPADIAAVYVTPAHQHPSGVTMTGPRRVALIEHARSRGAVVIEDDYDSEFRYDVAPLPALRQLGGDRVVYLGTASKTVRPGLRIGWLVASTDLVARLEEQRSQRHDLTSWPVQRAFQTLLRDGYVDKVVRSARRVYAERCRAVVDALSPFGVVPGVPAGMYVTINLPPSAVAAVRHDAAAAGYDLPALADYCRTSRLSGLVLGFGGVDEAQLREVLGLIQDSLRRHGPLA
jgi:GntR family transcriptional regulator/MocR family aminotransferase